MPGLEDDIALLNEADERAERGLAIILQVGKDLDRLMVPLSERHNRLLLVRGNLTPVTLDHAIAENDNAIVQLERMQVAVEEVTALIKSSWKNSLKYRNRLTS